MTLISECYLTIGYVSNGPELSRPTAQASPTPFSHTLAGDEPSRFRQRGGSAPASC